MLIKRNANVRRIAVETGLWDNAKPFSANMIKRRCEHGSYQYLDKKELAYAMRMGWVDEQKIMRA